jgi:hypothetical protein
MNTTTSKDATACACPDCQCEVTEGHHVSRNGKEYCSEACADGHTSGAGCCKNSCQCHG